MLRLAQDFFNSLQCHDGGRVKRSFHTFGLGVQWYVEENVLVSVSDNFWLDISDHDVLQFPNLPFLASHSFSQHFVFSGAPRLLMSLI